MCVRTRESAVLIHGNEGTIHRSPISELAIAWIGRYSQEVGDYCPRSGKLYIPHCYTRRDLHGVYRMEMQDVPGVDRILTVAWFSQLMRRHFPHLHLASRLMLGVCDECLRLSEARRKCTNEMEKAAFKRAQTIHLELQRAERVAYQARKLQSSTDPTGSWSIIVDYTDR